MLCLNQCFAARGGAGLAAKQGLPRPSRRSPLAASSTWRAQVQNTQTELLISIDAYYTGRKGGERPVTERTWFRTETLIPKPQTLNPKP